MTIYPPSLSINSHGSDDQSLLVFVFAFSFFLFTLSSSPPLSSKKNPLPSLPSHADSRLLFVTKSIKGKQANDLSLVLKNIKMYSIYDRLC